MNVFTITVTLSLSKGALLGFDKLSPNGFNFEAILETLHSKREKELAFDVKNGYAVGEITIG